MSFLQRLQTLIGDQTNVAFAKRCGISEGVVRRYLLGHGRPSFEITFKIAEACDVNHDWLLTGAGPMRREAPLPAPEPPVEAGPGVEEVLAVVLEVERLFQERDYHLPPEKKVRLIRLILESLVRREREAAEERERWLALTREWVLDRRGLLQMLEIVSS